MRYHQLRNDSRGFVATTAIVLLIIVAIFAGAITLQRDKNGTHVKVANGCKDTNITLQPVTITTATSPFTLRATLTMGGQPVNDERITFRIVGQDNHQRKLEYVTGNATTNTSGVVTLSKPDGLINDVEIVFGHGGTLTGLKAEFDGASAIKQNEPFYCGSNATVNFPSTITVQ